jgi:hypothetical protein
MLMRNATSSVCLAIGLGLLIGFTAGCSEEPASSPPSQPEPQVGMADGKALYGVNIEVSYAGRRELLADTAMVYVFLRPPGERMPLAVQQFSGRELPRSVSFAGARSEAVELVVRLSPSGRVDRSPEDVEVVEQLSGLRHPPETLSVVLGANAASAPPAEPEAADITAQANGISASISLADGHTFTEDAVVFVIARRPGQVMPSAVRRLSVGELPVDVELTDADSMTFSNRLSDSRALDLFARVSTSGTTSRSSSDWISETVRVDMARLPDSVALSIGPP